MGYDPTEYGLPDESDGSDLDVNQLLLSAQRGEAVINQFRAQAAQTAQRQPPPRPGRPVASATQPVSARDLIKQRLRLASYYEAILEQPLFDNQDQYSVAVETEIRQFIENRLAELLGTKRQPEQGASFSDVEIRALKALAVRLLSAGTAPRSTNVPSPTAEVASSEAPPEPVVARMRPPAPPAVSAVAEQEEDAEPRVAPVVRPKRKRRPVETEPEATEAARAEVTTTPPEAPRAPKAPPVRPIPMPTGSQMTAVSAAVASAVVEERAQSFERELQGPIEIRRRT